MLRVFPILLLTLAAHSQSRSPTLAAIRASKTLTCGINVEEPEYTLDDAHGNRSAFDLALCQAVAIAALGPHPHLDIRSYSDEADALAALQTGKIDVLASGSSTFLTSTPGLFAFTHPVFQDSQALLVDRSSNLHTARALAGKKICTLVGSEAQVQLEAFMARQHIVYLPFPFSEQGEMEAAFVTHNCDALSADLTELASERQGFRNGAAQYAILPDVIAPDPLAMASRTSDPQWSALLDWVVQALIQAEQLGITEATLSTALKSSDPNIARLLGTAHGYGQYLGLADDWAANILAALGNYAELFNRTLGQNSPMHLAETQPLTANPIR